RLRRRTPACGSRPGNRGIGECRDYGVPCECGHPSVHLVHRAVPVQTGGIRIPVPLPRSLAGQLFAVQAVLIAVVVAGYALFAYVSHRGQAEDAAGRQATAVARSVADSPSVREAIRGPDPSAGLQPYALAVVRHTDVDFVTIMDPRGVRWTHPDPDQIGRPFIGHTAPALQGRTFTETYTGTLGPSVRAVTPVRDGGRIVGLVSAGIRVEEISQRVEEQLTALLAVAAGALA